MFVMQLYNIMSQREAKLNLKIAGEQRRIANASKRDSTAMKTLSLMGALFLPGSFFASVFGMSFFNFEEGMLSPLPLHPPSCYEIALHR
jgi:Mg2+ and Co2+ transporter CorA